MRLNENMLLRLGLAVVFLYAAVSSFISPDNWIGYFPTFLRTLLPQQLLLNLFSIYEILLALWLIWGKWLYISALLSAVSLLGIIVFNLNQMDVIFRDIGLLFMALALIFSAKSRQ